MNLRPVLMAAAFALLAFAACRRASDTAYTRASNFVLVLRDTVAPMTLFDSLMLGALEGLARDSQIALAPFSDSLQLADENLPYYSAVVMLNFVEDSLRLWQRTALERYAAAGGGIVMTDAPLVKPYLWHWYSQALQQDWPAADTMPNAAFQKLAYGGGRLARLDQCYHQKPDTSLATQVKDAMNFAIGTNIIDYGKVSIPAAPEFSQFTRQVLDEDLYEPMEMEILPFGEVLFLERRGKIKLYDPAIEKTKVVAEFDVCIEGNYEDGLHGLALDPGYGRSNHYIYLYYSPHCDTAYQYLSRFVFKRQTLERDSEVVMLRVMVQRETCCHSGGGLEFGPDSLLYLSTGDNTSSKESDGFTPTDERPGRSPFDAQKSSGNTHDLRGKIIRIRPLPNGTYAIPNGNLFPKDGTKGRPEIYTMGCRNPFRISIDPKHNILYWGDVGPDGGEDGIYGPRSYDEFNQARSAGNYGWPYFVANNRGYPYRNFATDSVGLPQNPAQPHNYSPNNYGAKDLPPARPAMVWYPYLPAEPFWVLGAGSRSAMAGPFYYTDRLMPLTSVKFPAYYEGKWFIFDWARSWIKVVTFDEEQRPIQIEPFMPQMDLSKAIDMKFGPEGALYVLEYGNMYFMDNPDARLVKIKFAEGNRAPEAHISVVQAAGAAPHTTRFSGMASFDYDRKDSLCYEWFFDNYDEPQRTDKEPEFTFNRPGIYQVKLRVIDNIGEVDEATIPIQVGNAAPAIALESPQNRTFYFGGGSWPYSFVVSDEEDGQSKAGIDPDRAWVSYSYVKDYNLRREILTGRAQLPEGPIQHLEGGRLIKGSDCYSCHSETEKNVGPAFQAVAARYKSTEANLSRLTQKVIQGGNGTWGEAVMSAHPQLDPPTVRKMLQYVLSLGEAGRLPLSGNIGLTEHLQNDTLGLYVVSALYKDKGASPYEAVTTRFLNIIRPPRMEAEHCSKESVLRIPKGEEPGAFQQANLRAGGYLLFKQIDLTGLSGLKLRVQYLKQASVQLRLDSPQGKVAATLSLPANPAEGWQELMMRLPATAGLHDIYLVLACEQDYDWLPGGRRKARDMCWVDWVEAVR